MRLPSLSFSGSSLHVFYQIGVAHELLCQNVTTPIVCATSAGMAAALYYLLDLRDCLPISQLLNTLPRPEKCAPSVCGNMCRGILLGEYCVTSLQIARERMLHTLAQVLKKHRPNAYKQVSG